MSESKDYALSLVCLASIICIFSCHLLQYYKHLGCNYLNIGVWLFLFISGFIYGKRTLQDVFSFYLHRMIRILVPYYIILIVAVSIEMLVGQGITFGEVFSSAMCLQWYGESVPNCGHLWYISCIIFCYLVTPVLQRIKDQIEKMPFEKFCTFFVLSILMFQIANHFRAVAQPIVRILPYIGGYFIAAKEKDIPDSCKNKLALILVLGTFGTMYAIESFGLFHIPKMALDYFKSVVATIVVMYSLRFSMQLRSNRHCRLILDIIDRYSYEFYLTHNFFILGTLSVMQSTPNIFLNCVLAALCATGTCIVLHKISYIIIKSLNRVLNKPSGGF